MLVNLKPFDIKLDTHMPDVFDKNPFLACQHFSKLDIASKFTLIKTIQNNNKPKKVPQNILENGKNFRLKC